MTNGVFFASIERMSPLKKVLVFFGFFSIVALNFVAVVGYYFTTKIAHNRQTLLSEIGTIASQKTQNTAISAPFVLGTMENEITVGDGRAANLKNFFRKYRSPLFDYAEYIVATSDKYKFDYRLLPAIAMQESQGCLKIPEDSRNCWGFGIYGDNVLKFDSYEQAIETVAEAIKHDYIDRGLITPEDVMSRYTPSSKGSWASAVTFFFQALE